MNLPDVRIIRSPSPLPSPQGEGAPQPALERPPLPDPLLLRRRGGSARIGFFLIRGEGGLLWSAISKAENALNHPSSTEPMTNGSFTAEQKEYLAGLFAGAAARGQRFSDVEPPSRNEDLIFEERVKRELHPLDAYGQIVENAASNKGPDKEDVFRFKWNGLFF